MCIIFLSTDLTNRPTLKELKRAQETNPHGAGYAFVESGKVLFSKHETMNYKEVHEVISNVPGPIIAHFRITSSGYTCSELAHPFPITTNPDKLDILQGEADAVFAHNGTIQSSVWQQLLMQTDLTKVPPGPWSDSRALAYVLAVFKSANILDIWENQNRFCTLNSRGEMFKWGDWVKMREGLWSSNQLQTWKYSTKYSKDWTPANYTATPNPPADAQLPACTTTSVYDSAYAPHGATLTAYDYEGEGDSLLGREDPENYGLDPENWTEAQWQAWGEGIPVEDVIEANEIIDFKQVTQ